MSIPKDAETVNVGPATSDVLVVVAAIWEEIFHTKPPNETTLAALANGRNEQELRKYLHDLKSQMKEQEEILMDEDSAAIHWKGQIELECMQDENQCSIPSIPIVEITDLDIDKSAAEGVDIEIFRLVLSRRFVQADGTKADAIMNFSGTKLDEENRAAYLSLLSKIIVKTHNEVLDGKRFCDFTVVPLAKNNEKHGPVIATDKDGAQMLGLLAIPSFVNELKERVLKASNEHGGKFELVILPISKRVIVACNAYDRASCIGMSRINQDPGIAGNQRERLQYACPLTIKTNILKDREDIEPCDVLPILMKDRLPVVYQPYPYRTACYLALPKDEERGLVPSHAPWGGYFIPNKDGRGVTGCCSSCTTYKSDLRLCTACGRAAYCNTECQHLHWKKHKHLCNRERDSQEFWRNLKIESQNATPEVVPDKIPTSVVVEDTNLDTECCNEKKVDDSCCGEKASGGCCNNPDCDEDSEPAPVAKEVNGVFQIPTIRMN